MKPKITFHTIVADRENCHFRFLSKREKMFVYGYLLKHAPNNTLTVPVDC